MIVAMDTLFGCALIATVVSAAFAAVCLVCVKMAGDTYPALTVVRPWWKVW